MGLPLLGSKVLGGLEFLGARAEVFGSNFGGLGSRASISDTYFTLYKQNGKTTCQILKASDEAYHSARCLRVLRF